MRWYKVIGMVNIYLEEKDVFTFACCSGVALHVARMLLFEKNEAAPLRWYVVMPFIQEYLEEKDLATMMACSGMGTHVALSCLEMQNTSLLPIAEDAERTSSASKDSPTRAIENEILHEHEVFLAWLEGTDNGDRSNEWLGDSD